MPAEGQDFFSDFGPVGEFSEFFFALVFGGRLGCDLQDLSALFICEVRCFDKNIKAGPIFPASCAFYGDLSVELLYEVGFEVFSYGSIRPWESFWLSSMRPSGEAYPSILMLCTR